MTSGAGRESRAASASAASRAALIIARPPDACTLTIHTPSRVAAATAPATVLGMSWNFRSRKTRSPRAASSSTNDGPWLVNSRLPILNPPTTPRSSSASARARSDGVDVERHEQLIHVRSTPSPLLPFDRADQIGDARDPMTLHVVADAVEQLRPDERIDEVGRADLDRRCAGDDELERVARVGDAAHADDRDLHQSAGTRRPCARRSAGSPARSVRRRRSRSSAAASRRRAPSPGTC